MTRTPVADAVGTARIMKALAKANAKIEAGANVDDALDVALEDIARTAHLQCEQPERPWRECPSCGKALETTAAGVFADLEED